MKPSPAERPIGIELLDSRTGEPVQAWNLDARRIRIGRGQDLEVSISSSRVSRLHVELLPSGGQWVIYSHGKNGTLIDGRQISCQTVRGDTVLQLGPEGPTLRIRLSGAVSTSGATVGFERQDLSALNFDPERTRKDVERLAGEPTFQKLKESKSEPKRG